MIQLIEQHFPTTIICFTVLIGGLIVFKFYKFKKLIELDMGWKKYEGGNLSQERRARNIWDYSFFPGLSRLWHQSEWQTALAIFILLFLLCIYLYTKDDKLYNLLGLNFGVVIGMMIQRKSS